MLTRPATARKRAGTAPGAMREEMLIEMQFADIAEVLRRMCFAYGNRYIEADRPDSDVEADGPPGSLADDEEAARIFQLPNTDAEPYDSARVSPAVLMAFAEDTMITPHLLLQHEATQAVMETLDRRRKRAHLAASLERTLCDFVTACAMKVMAKKPYSNVFGCAPPAEKVRALVDFISVDYDQVVHHILGSRFSPINEIKSVQTAVVTEAQRSKQKKRKYKTIDAARAGVSELWAQVHEIFLFFCQAPLSWAQPGPQMHDPVANDVEHGCDSSSSEQENKVQKVVSTPSKHKVEFKVPTPSKHKVEFKVDAEIFNLETIIDFHPTIRKAKEVFAAQQIQRCFRRKFNRPAPVTCAATKYTEFSTKTCLDISPKLFTSSEYPKPPSQPLGPIVASLIPQASLLTDGVTLQSVKPHDRILSHTGMHRSDDFRAAAESKGCLDTMTRKSSEWRTLPVNQLIEWKRKIVEQDWESDASFNALYTSKGKMASAKPMLRKSDEVGKRPQKQKREHAAHLRHGPSGTENAATPRVSMRSRSSNADSVSNSQGSSARCTHGAPKTRQMTVFSDDPAERKAALNHMARRERKDIKTMRITQEVEALHERVLEKWRLGTEMHDPFTHSFDKAAVKIQRMGRAWLTRKIVREGKFLRDGMKAWLSARPKAEFSSTVATIQFAEVVKMFKILEVCPQIVDVPEILQVSLETARSSDRVQRQSDSSSRTSLTWNEFQEVCWRLSLKMSQLVLDDANPLEEMDGLLQVDEFLRSLVEGKPEAFDLNRTADWIRARMLEHADKRLASQSEQRRAMSPTRSVGNLELMNAQNRGLLSTGAVISSKGFLQSKDQASRSGRRSQLSRSAVSDGDARGTKSSKAGSFVAGTIDAADGVGSYTSTCAHLDIDPIPSVINQMNGAILNLSHYQLEERQIEAISAGIEKNTCVATLIMVDAGLSAASFTLLCAALKKNNVINHFDFSENSCMDRHSILALSEYVAKSNSLRSLILRGVGMSDNNFDYLVRNGIDSNPRSLTHIDVSYNMLTDESTENIKQMIMGGAKLQSLLLCWNLFSSASEKEVQVAVHERSKPRSSKRADNSAKIIKPLAKISVQLRAEEQRVNIMLLDGVSGMRRWTPSAAKPTTQADYVTLRVTQRNPKLTSLLKFRLTRLFTSGRSLSPEMIAEQLQSNFKDVETKLQRMAIEMLLQKLISSEINQISQIKALIDGDLAVNLDQYLKISDTTFS